MKFKNPACWINKVTEVWSEDPPNKVGVDSLKEKIEVRPEFFYFLVLGKFLGKPSVGGGNKNKNEIQKFPESE